MSYAVLYLPELGPELGPYVSGGTIIGTIKRRKREILSGISQISQMDELTTEQLLELRVIYSFEEFFTSPWPTATGRSPWAGDAIGWLLHNRGLRWGTDPELRDAPRRGDELANAAALGGVALGPWSRDTQARRDYEAAIELADDLERKAA